MKARGFATPAVITALNVALLAVAFLMALRAPGEAAAQTPRDGAGGYDPSLFEGMMQYRTVGPARGGRVTTVTGHRAQPHTFYMGSTGGGIWKTTDYGHTWRNVSDGELGTASIGAIQVAGSDTSVVYAGTGSDGLRSNVITGRGIYKSTDAGQTWRLMGLEETGQIGAVEVHPKNPGRVYVAALGRPFRSNPERGVYRSTDGGQTWENVLHVSDSTGAIDLEMHPADPQTLYAAMWRGERKPWTIISGARREDGLYRSTDGGDSWTKLENGLPQGLVGKIDLAVSPDAPDRVWALVEAKEPHEGLYRSDDRGETWTQVSDKEGLMERPFYYTNVTADPTDADVVYVNDENFYKSTDGGRTFEEVDTPHGDNHDLWINPGDPEIMIQSNDGGANVTLDGAKTWTTQHNQPTAELYQVDVDGRFPYWLYAGQQDESTITVPSRPPSQSAPAGSESWWHAVGGCETGPAVPRPGDPTVVYANCKGRFGRYSRATGQEKQYYVGAQYMYGRNPARLDYRFQRTAPIEVDPGDPNTVYHGSQYVHRTTDEGATWERISPDLTADKPQYQVVSGRPITRDITGEEHYSTLYTIEVSPHDSDVIWAGANDGPVHVTRDGGQSWRDVAPPEMPENGRIDAIDPSPHRPGKAYVAMHRRLLGDFAPYVYETEDYGQTWTKLTGEGRGIPADYPVRVAREDPAREGLLYAGTDFGMFVSFDDGSHWQRFQQNLPVTPITDIKLHRGDLVLSTMGRGFWIMDDLAPLRQMTEAVASSQAHLFDPQAAYRMRYRYRSNDPADPQYPPPGAMIDYYLAEEPEGPLTLEIMDADGDVIRTFTSGEPERTPPPEGATRERRRRATFATDSLAATPGMHRFVWDLEYPGTWRPAADEGEEGPEQAGPGDDGPMVVPGRFRVRLSTEDWSRARSLRVEMDPRVEADGVTRADLREQLGLNLKIRDAISRARRAADEIGAARRDVSDAVEAGEMEDEEATEMRRELFDVERSLVTAGEASREEEAQAGSYPPPMLIDQLEYLYYMTTEADQKLGRDAFQRYEDLRGRLDDVLDHWKQTREQTAVPGTTDR